jgi:MOSC domain-containing protein YiiM
MVGEHHHLYPLAGLPQNPLHIEGVVLEITGDCTPCDFLDTLRPGLKEAILGRRGLLARVAHGGELKVGSPVYVQSPEGIGATASAS